MRKTAAAVIIVFLGLLASACASMGPRVLEDGRTRFGSAGTRELKKAAVIEGYVIDSTTRKGIPGATVEIKNAGFGIGYYRLTTSGSGHFRIDDFIQHVRYTIEAVADGYVPYRQTGTIEPGSRTIILHREGILEGTVTDSAGRPAGAVEVRLTPQYIEYSTGGRRPLMTSTDTQGRYRFNALPEGSYRVLFQKEGYIAETALIQHIKKGERFSLPMMLFRPATITGKITIKEIDTPAMNIDITLQGRVSHSTSSYHDGSYRLEDIKPGNYRMVLTHQGFHGIKTPVITIREGQSIRDHNFTVTPKDPRVQVYAYRYTFVPGSKVEFNLKTFRIEKITARIYRVPLQVLLNGRSDPNALDPGKEGFKEVRKWETGIKDFQPYEWRYQSLDLSEALPPGGYCVEVIGAGRTIDRKFFTVTTVGVVVKRSRESVFAYATNLVNNRPLEGASVVVFDNTPVRPQYRRSVHPYKPPQRIEDLPVKIVARGATDGEGLYLQRMKSEKHLSVLVIGRDGSYAFCSTGSPYTFLQEEKKFFIYTDRPVYRAGDTVHYKIIGKKRDERFKPLARLGLHYKVTNRDFESTLEEGTTDLDEWGTAEGTIKLGNDTRLGEHEIRVGQTPDNLYGSGRFYVEQYRKPEFSIEITPAMPYFINGDTAEFKVAVKYFFGAPLKGALIRYRFYESRLRDTDTVYWWEEDYGASESYNRIKLDGMKFLDDAGMAMMKLHVGDYPYDREITLETTVVDKSNVSITSSTSVKVGRGDFYIKINPRKNFYSNSERKKVDIKTIAHDGKPVSAPVQVRAFRYIWKPWQRVYVHDTKPVFEKKIYTDRKGVHTLELPAKFDQYGEFDIVAEGRDRKNNAITASRVVWIYGPGGEEINSRFKNLELAVNTDELKEPGEITCLLKSRFTDAYVCLTLEGKDIYDRKVVKMKGNIEPVRLKIRREYAPNLYITATMQRNRALFTSTVGVSLPSQDTALSIKMTPDRERYKPGEKATITLSASDDKGAPLKADLSLGVVDEAIYRIRRDHTPKMLDFFYTRISNWVSTAYSYPITVLAGAAKDARVKVRQKFMDTAFWISGIKTDSNGLAKVRFTLPDNLTTWRLTSRGHDMAGRVGEKKDQILVTQDLIARIGKPRFLIEGDRVGIIGIVNSNTTRGLAKITTEFRVDDTAVSPDEPVSISLPAYGSAREFYTLTVPEGKRSLSLFYRAVADKEAGDALKINVPVESRGAPYTLFGYGDMSLNREVTISPLSDTDDFEFRPVELKISVNPSPVIQMVRASKFLAEYPYGCMEQTINRFLPAMALKKLLEQKGMTALAPDTKLDDKIAQGVERILNSRNDDGTWGWWYGDRGNEFITGYVLYSLNMAGHLGYGFDKRRIRSSLDAAGRMLSRKDLIEDDARAYLLYVYSLWGRWQPGVISYFNRQKQLNAYQLSFLIRAMAAAGSIQNLSREERDGILKAMPAYTTLLKSMQRKDSRGIYWESQGAQGWGWQGGNVEMTAHVLSALMESGDRSPLPAQMVSSLGKRTRDGRWNSTKETATVIFAITAYLEGSRGALTDRGSLSFTLDGKTLASLAYDTSKSDAVTVLTRKVRLEQGLKGKQYRIAATGDAGPDASFDLALCGNLYFKKQGLLGFLKSEESSLRSLENGIGLYRNFYSIRRVKDINNNEYMVPQKLSQGNPLKVGEELLVKVRFRAQDSFEYMVLEDYLPSGFEVVDQNAYDDYQPYVHAERWDNRMVFFFTRVRKGEIYEVAYILRAELPGEFIVKPARMECMYEPSIQGWSAPAHFTVEKK